MGRSWPNRKIGLSGLHGGNEVCAAPELDQSHLNIGIGAPPGAYSFGQDSDAYRKERPHVEFAGIDTRRPPGGAAGPVCMRQAGPGVGKSHTTGGGQPDASGQPFEQRSTEVTFQGLDLVRQTRLGDMKPGRSASERPLIHHLDEVFELTQ